MSATPSRLRSHWLTSQRLKRRRIVVVGNPGVGKSTICNAIVRQNVFVTGHGAAAVTTELQSHSVTDETFHTVVVDVPGLFDIRGDQSSLYNTALTTSDPTIILFVVTPQVGGRVCDDDVAAFKAVISSLPQIHDTQCAVVVNKTSATAIKQQLWIDAFAQEFSRRADVSGQFLFYFIPECDVDSTLAEIVDGIVSALQPAPLIKDQDIVVGMAQVDAEWHKLQKLLRHQRSQRTEVASAHSEELDAARADMSRNVEAWRQAHLAERQRVRNNIDSVRNEAARTREQAQSQQRSNTSPQSSFVFQFM